jgi:hypothetical protein
MAIVQTRKPPEAGSLAIGRALNDLRGQPERAELLGGAEIDLSQPLPVYRLGLDEVEGHESLDRAKHVGWRYLVEPPGGGSVAYADVKETSGGGSRFASLSQNRNAERLMQAAHLAQQVAEDLPDDCEARVLDVPALYLSAIWLTAARPIFIPYIDAQRLADPSAKIEVEPDFLNRLLNAARTARQQLNNTPPGPAPPAAAGTRSP